LERGIGVTIGLPLLDAMAPALAQPHRVRLACIEMVHGAAGSAEDSSSRHYWSPAQEDADFEFSYSLEALASLRRYIKIVSGTDARQADAFEPTEVGADHFRIADVTINLPISIGIARNLGYYKETMS
jgi:hypothetical protein